MRRISALAKVLASAEALTGLALPLSFSPLSSPSFNVGSSAQRGCGFLAAWVAWRRSWSVRSCLLASRSTLVRPYPGLMSALIPGRNTLGPVDVNRGASAMSAKLRKARKITSSFSKRERSAETFEPAEQAFDLVAFRVNRATLVPRMPPACLSAEPPESCPDRAPVLVS